MRSLSVSAGESLSPISLPQTENHKQSRASSPPVMPKRASGGFALLDSLVRHGVDYIFGYPGGAILPIYDDLYKVEATGAMKHILVRHEQGAAHAADGYARATGKVGVCFGTSGPGATNLVTGIATAYMDSI
ncbi:thiamine pyrophosphate-binding protein, partial [Nostoc sp. NMS4]|uniref:thiamine pyrophosphate-binding protein n=1 Tax=Nostoc sp. NMS4 TaxID=2815390 RepID=UPI0025E033AD